MCGIAGVFNHPQASVMTYYGLHALQHRGQEAAGIVSSYYDEEKNKRRSGVFKGEGHVLDVFSDGTILTDKLRGDSAIGHTRYSTTGANSLANIQPFHMNYRLGNISIAHNGNLTNTRELRKRLQDEGAIFQTTTDSELFLHLIARSRKETQIEQIREALQITRGAYSLLVQTENSLIAARDPHGIRPLAIGRIKNEDGTFAFVVASETCAFDIISAEYLRDVQHNEMIIIDRTTIETGEITSLKIEDVTPEAKHCIFEYIYFSRPDSFIYGNSVDKVRRKLGKNLAVESPIHPDNEEEKVTVIGVPDSATTATLGYADSSRKLGINSKFEIGLIRSHYVGRTFISPGQNNREFKVKTKFNTVRGVLEDKKVVVIDDSIVRGTTSKSLVKLIREANPREVHMRITSPPIKYPCFYGMDFPTRSELIANYHEDEEHVGEAIHVDSLHYLSVNMLMDSVPQQAGCNYCTACFTGNYPVEIEADANKSCAEND
jgi:amidophosphoribosyltransferase